MTPSPLLLGKLARAKLLTRWQSASVGVGDRRSSAKGAGLEFADHREYQPGDDLRHLDPHIFARFNKNYIRQYDVYRQLPITILVDGSRSMDSGDPNKFAFALNLASALGFVGLAGGDQVQLGVGAGDRIYWSPKFHGVARAQRMFDWIGGREPAGTGSFGAAVHVAVRHLTDRGLLVVLSDWWSEDVDGEFRIMAAAGQELWGMQILSPEELDPALLGDGETRLEDMESGHEIELTLDRTARERYARGLDRWREQLRALFAGVHGRYLLVPSNEPLDRLFMQDWRQVGLIG